MSFIYGELDFLILNDFSDNIGGDTNKSEFLTLSKAM